MSKTPQPESESKPDKKIGIKELYKNKTARWVTGLSIGILGFLYYQSSFDDEANKYTASFAPYSDFLNSVNARKITKVIETETSDGEFILQGSGDGKLTRAKRPANESFIQATKDSGVTYQPLPRKQVSPLIGFFSQWWPLLLVLGGWLYLHKKREKELNAQMKNMGVMGGGNGGAVAFGKSRAKLMQDKSASNVKFSDVAGADEAKLEVAEIVEFLKDPEKFKKMGTIIPNGLLLAGGPGLGKTLLAKAIAGEAKVPFFSISGSAFVEMFVGVGAARVRDMFAEAKKNAPCIIFIDEIDAMAKKRGGANPNDERESTLNQMLVEMDGFEPNSGVMIMAATNRPELLDPAIMRPGRFSRQVTMNPPDVKGRMEILQVHARKMNKIAERRVFGQSIDFKKIAKMLMGFSGAELANLLNEAGVCAVRRNAKFIHLMDVLEAKDKIQMGFKQKGLMTDRVELDKTACHEVGHALCAYFLSTLLKGKVDKITIVPRSKSLGHTSILKDDDQYCYNKEQLKARMIYLFGGKVAEQVYFNQTSTGAANDLERITATAREMIMQYAMGDKLAPRNYMPDFSRGVPIATMSELHAQQVDDEINELVWEAEASARQMIEDHAAEFRLLWDAVNEFETLEMEDVEILMKEKSMDRLREVRTARETAMKESADSELAEESLKAEGDDPPKGVAKGDLWNYTPR